MSQVFFKKQFIINTDYIKHSNKTVNIHSHPYTTGNNYLLTFFHFTDMKANANVFSKRYLDENVFNKDFKPILNSLKLLLKAFFTTLRKFC